MAEAGPVAAATGAARASLAGPAVFAPAANGDKEGKPARAQRIAPVFFDCPIYQLERSDFRLLALDEFRRGFLFPSRLPLRARITLATVAAAVHEARRCLAAGTARFPGGPEAAPEAAVP